MVVGLVEGLVGCDSSRRGSAGCFPSRATGLPVELSCDAALTLATWVESELVVAVSVEVCPWSVIGLKSEVDAIS